MVEKDEVSATTAVAMVKKHGGKKAAETLAEAHKQVAACGGKRVTPRHLGDGVNWKKTGPELKNRVLALRGAEDLHAAVADLIAFVDAC
jgi:hypothetical protein